MNYTTLKLFRMYKVAEQKKSHFGWMASQKRNDEDVTGMWWRHRDRYQRLGWRLEGEITRRLEAEAGGIALAPSEEK